MKLTITDIENPGRPVMITGEITTGYTVADVQRLVATGFAHIAIEEPVQAKAAKE